jgi:CheY-like chemotaxis protein
LARKKVLLCIDDESTGLRVRKLILERNGYTVFTAEAGEEGLGVFDRETIDAVIMDYFMPGMDGGTVAKSMKLRNPKIPIIRLSAFYSLPDGATEAADAFLTKGDSPEVLLSKLTDLLGGEQLA